MLRGRPTGRVLWPWLKAKLFKLQTTGLRKPYIGAKITKLMCVSKILFLSAHPSSSCMDARSVPVGSLLSVKVMKQ